MTLRIIELQLKRSLFQGRAVVVFGARRVGKTTLVKQVIDQYPEKRPRYINCEILANKQALETTDAKVLEAFLVICPP